MKKLLILPIILLILLLSLRLNSLTNIYPYEVNIRDRPSPKGELLSTVNRGDRVFVIESPGAWTAIEWEGKTAYLYRTSLYCDSLTLAHLPITIPCRLSYRWTPQVLASDTMAVANRKIPKEYLQILLGAMLIFLLRKKKKAGPKSSKYSKPSKDNRQSNYSKPQSQSYRPKQQKNPPGQRKSAQPQKTAPPYETQQDKTAQEEKYKRMGFQFEEYIIEKLDDRVFSFDRWTSDKITQSGHYPADSRDPDLMFTHIKGKASFHIECKYRSSDKIWLKQHKIEHYKGFAKKSREPVFLAIGTEGTPSSPKNLYIIPIEDLPHASAVNYMKGKYRKKNVTANFYFDPKEKKLK
ncbi:MAG: hypothetical protein PQJ60_06560 [Spirochaetales bacterium]|nr:hypothetical protein [Spirochaetales bacterium]